MPVNPGFSGLNFALHCVIKRPYQPRVCNMSMIPCLFSLAVALICECARLASVCRSDPDVCRLVTDASVDVEKSQLASIRSEMAMLESSGKRGCGLKLVYRYSLSIPPSSVDAERTFSAAGVLCTKVGSQWVTSLLTRCVFCSPIIRRTNTVE